MSGSRSGEGIPPAASRSRSSALPRLYARQPHLSSIGLISPVHAEFWRLRGHGIRVSRALDSKETRLRAGILRSAIWAYPLFNPAADTANRANQKLKTAGLMVDRIDQAHVSDAAETWVVDLFLGEPKIESRAIAANQGRHAPEPFLAWNRPRHQVAHESAARFECHKSGRARSQPRANRSGFAAPFVVRFYTAPPDSGLIMRLRWRRVSCSPAISRCGTTR